MKKGVFKLSPKTFLKKQDYPKAVENRVEKNTDNENKLSERKPTRVKNFDYNSKGAYFITICTENRCRILSGIVEDSISGQPATRQINDTQESESQTNVGGDVLTKPQRGLVYAPPVGKGLTVIGSIKRVFTRSFSNQSNERRVEYAPKTIEIMPYGEIAEKFLKKMNEFYENICIDRYVIMPNHIHIILNVSKDGASRTSPPTKQHSAVSQFVSTFKCFL